MSSRTFWCTLPSDCDPRSPRSVVSVCPRGDRDPAVELRDELLDGEASAMAIARASPAYLVAGTFGVEAGREWERLERGGRSVARVVAFAEPCAEPQQPQFVEPAVLDLEGRVVLASDGHGCRACQCRRRSA